MNQLNYDNCTKECRHHASTYLHAYPQRFSYFPMNMIISLAHHEYILDELVIEIVLADSNIRYNYNRSK